MATATGVTGRGKSQRIGSIMGRAERLFVVRMDSNDNRRIGLTWRLLMLRVLHVFALTFASGRGEVP